jgi:hypothetical protein
MLIRKRMRWQVAVLSCVHEDEICVTSQTHHVTLTCYPEPTGAE